MNDISKLIAKEIAKSDKAINAKRGDEFLVNFTVQGQAVVRKGEDFEQVVSFAVPYEKIIGVLFSKVNGVTMDAVVREALETDLNDSDIKAQALEAVKRVKGTGVRKMSGKITVKEEATDVFDVDVCPNC